MSLYSRIYTQIESELTGLPIESKNGIAAYYTVLSQRYLKSNPIITKIEKAIKEKYGDDAIQNPKKSLFNNIDSTINILEYARLNKIPVIYAGSSSAHGDIYANPYTFTKWNGEELCKLYTNVYDLPTVTCRFYNVYGEGQLTEGAYCTVLGIFERLYKQGKALTVTGDGLQRRDFTYVGDIVDGLIRCAWALESNRSHRVSGEIFELGNGKNYSILDLVDAFGETDEVEYIAARPGEVRESLNTDTKARDILGWEPKGDIIEYIKENYILDK